MAYDYNGYYKKYNEENILIVSLKLSRKKDGDLVEILEKTDNKSKTVKELMRKGMNK